MQSCTLLACVNQLNDFNFCYPFCNICRCKTQPTAFDTSRWKCIRNGHLQNAAETQYCYRLNLNVTDGHHVCDITVFGESVDELFGDSATNMKGYLAHLEGRLQGLELSANQLVREAMVMSISGKTFVFDFNLPSNLATRSANEEFTLDRIQSILGSRLIARTIRCIVSSSAGFFTVRKGIELQMKKFMSDSLNGSGFHLSFAESVDSSGISLLPSPDMSLSLMSASAAAPSERDMLVAVWNIPSVDQSPDSNTTSCDVASEDLIGNLIGERLMTEVTDTPEEPLAMNARARRHSESELSLTTSILGQLSIGDDFVGDVSPKSSKPICEEVELRRTIDDEMCFTHSLCKSIRTSSHELTSTPIAYRLRQKPYHD